MVRRFYARRMHVCAISSERPLPTGMKFSTTTSRMVRPGNLESQIRLPVFEMYLVWKELLPWVF